MPEADRRFYAKAYAQPGGMRAGFEYFKAFERDAAEFAELGKTPLPSRCWCSPVKGRWHLPDRTGKLVATDVKGVIVKGSGHWLMEEAPDQVIPALISFLG